jgi:thymidylate synthase (FAD)
VSNDNHERRYGQAPDQAKKVLNEGLVQLVDHMGSDLSVVRNARVSYDAEWRAGEDSGSDAKLIKYLMKNGHNTPFEAPYITFEIIAPIFVIRQWHRHRTQSYNELSARYKELGCEFFLPEAHTITMQSEDNKQMRTNVQHPDALHIRELMSQANIASVSAYRQLLALGTPRELARSVLPVGIYTHMFASANLHNWMRFLKERLHEHAQLEIQVYAVEIAKILAELYPVTMQAFKELNTENTHEKDTTSARDDVADSLQFVKAAHGKRKPVRDGEHAVTFWLGDGYQQDNVNTSFYTGPDGKRYVVNEHGELTELE